MKERKGRGRKRMLRRERKRRRKEGRALIGREGRGI